MIKYVKLFCVAVLLAFLAGVTSYLPGGLGVAFPWVFGLGSLIALITLVCVLVEFFSDDFNEWHENHSKN